MQRTGPRCQRAIYRCNRGTGRLSADVHYSHNLHFLAIAATTQGRCVDAVDAENASPQMFSRQLSICRCSSNLFSACDMRLRFVANAGMNCFSMQPPTAKTPALLAFWLHGHGSALAATSHLAKAEVEEKELAAIVKVMGPRTEIFMLPIENHSWQIYQIADDLFGSPHCVCARK